jgi:hypothetical protein
MARILSHQEDFKNQVSMLEQIITAAGHLCIFLPKFHCELNPIEMVHSQQQQPPPPPPPPPAPKTDISTTANPHTLLPA